MGHSAAFFDLDKTVIAKSSQLAFSRPFYQGGLLTRRAALAVTYSQLVFLLNGADDAQLARMRDQFAKLCRGWEVAQVREIVAETLHDLIHPAVYAEAATLIVEHQAAGRDVVLVSTAGEEVVAPIGELLGVDHVIATRMVIEDGKYTGEISFYAAGPNKAVAIRELAETGGYDLTECYAYSDSISDVPMLSAVGHPAAVNPDRALRKVALERDWPILSFQRPVNLPRRFKKPSPLLAIAALGVAAGAVLGVYLYGRLRRPSR